ncbi:MAG TPA: hypothetical protein VGO89_06840 [Streptomyces sp.]|nr:hypothetical protein [Streptomyces sp.]
MTFARPLAPDHGFDGARGDPTPAGAWLVHAMTALGVHVVCFAAPVA